LQPEERGSGEIIKIPFKRSKVQGSNVGYTLR
jgi:hypothetical protein